MIKNIKKVLNLFNPTCLKSSIKRTMQIGISSSFVLLLFSTLLFALYIEFHFPNFLYEIGATLFKSSSMFIAFFIIYGISFNKIASDFNLK